MPPLTEIEILKTKRFAGLRELLSCVGANNADNAGSRGANANNRGANTNTNYGFPLNHLRFSFL